MNNVLKATMSLWVNISNVYIYNEKLDQQKQNFLSFMIN